MKTVDFFWCFQVNKYVRNQQMQLSALHSLGEQELHQYIPKASEVQILICELPNFANVLMQYLRHMNSQLMLRGNESADEFIDS